jgi:hypothetical protein
MRKASLKFMIKLHTGIDVYTSYCSKIKEQCHETVVEIRQ